MKKIFSLLICFSLFFNKNYVYAENLNFENSPNDINKCKTLFNDQSDKAVTIFNSKNTPYCITEDDLYLMSQVVYAESRGELYEGKVAVASVILNRLLSPNFPNTIREVIMQKNAFSCVINGEIKVIPDNESFNAVLDAIQGKDPTNKALFFYNPTISTCSWMKNINKQNMTTIGNHVFFATK